jgi:hypothetical protein
MKDCMCKNCGAIVVRCGSNNRGRERRDTKEFNESLGTLELEDSAQINKKGVH